MVRRILLSYAQAEPLIKEGDVLLHRSTAWYSKIIQKFTRSPYSHASIASWHNGNNLLELVEFHGFRGGVTRILSRAVEEESGCIDVYRPTRQQQRHSYDESTSAVLLHIDYLDAKAITNTMRQLTGLPYRWKRMWQFVKQYLIIFRLFYNIDNITDDTVKTIQAPVCSTSIAYAFAKNNFDLIPNKADNCVKPSDLACSPMLNYIFTIT